MEPLKRESHLSRATRVLRQARGDLYSLMQLARGGGREREGEGGGLKNNKGEGIERNNDKATDDGSLEEGVPSFTSDEGVEAGTRGFVFTWESKQRVQGGRRGRIEGTYIHLEE
jgi:hypothetical protein